MVEVGVAPVVVEVRRGVCGDGEGEGDVCGSGRGGDY